MSAAVIWKGSPLGFDRDGRPISYTADDDSSGNAPTLIYGPPGTSQTVGLICPELLDEPGKRSYIVVDPKGEICAITCKYRRSLPGHRVKIVNGYGLLAAERPDMKSDKWNPLGDLYADASGFGDECQAKGDALIKTGSNEHQPHFPDSARSGLTATIMQNVKTTRAQGRPPSLADVKATLSLPPDQLRPIIQEMVDSGDYDIATRAAKFLADNTEIQNIKSTIETQTAWMSKQLRADMDTESGVDLHECTKHPTTVYFILPANELLPKAPYFRLFLSSALRALYRHDGVPTTIIIEEAFIAGYHAEIEQALSVLRGFGSRLTVVFQSYQQIKKLYPDTHGLFTAGAMLAFRPADLESAEMLVKKADKVIVPVLSAADPTGPSDFGARPSWQQQQRDRIPLAKMFGMPKGRALVWKPGDEKPRVSWVKGYFDIPELNARASPNPYYRGGAEAKTAPRRKASSQSKIALALAAAIIGLLLLVH
jgi:type IV secretion system protein VirD4